MPQLARSRVDWSRLALALVVIVLAAILVWQLGILDAAVERLSALLYWLDEVARDLGFWGAAAFVVLAALSVTLGPFTSAPLVPVAILAWGRWSTLFLLLLGWMVGDIGAYAIGRWGGAQLLHRFIPRHRIDEWKRRIPEGRALAVALLVRLAMPSEVAYAFGVLRFPLVKFLVLTVIAEVPTAALLVFGSEALLRGDTVRVATWIGVAVGVVAIVWLIRSVQRHQRA